jgi:ubiquinone/menaquinone biosynthesis C-methylase UbiE
MAEERAGEDWYYEATRENLLRSIEDPSRVQAVADAVAAMKVERVLDVGCGIGQALFPLAISRGAAGVGVDISETGCRMGREFYAAHFPEARIEFLLSRAESLPFASASFDVVHCGLALPYTHNARTLTEIARVLSPGGLFLLRVHHLRYYLQQFKQALGSLKLLSAVHAGRVLTAGAIYHLTRRQPHTRIFNETFQTRWMLARELAKHEMAIEREQPGSSPHTPAFVIYKKQ